MMRHAGIIADHPYVGFTSAYPVPSALNEGRRTKAGLSNMTSALRGIPRTSLEVFDPWAQVYLLRPSRTVLAMKIEIDVSDRIGRKPAVRARPPSSSSAVPPI